MILIPLFTLNSQLTWAPIGNLGVTPSFQGPTKPVKGNCAWIDPNYRKQQKRVPRGFLLNSLIKIATAASPGVLGFPIESP
jgi:hypothetical protein